MDLLPVTTFENSMEAIPFSYFFRYSGAKTDVRCHWLWFADQNWNFRFCAVRKLPPKLVPFAAMSLS